MQARYIHVHKVSDVWDEESVVLNVYRVLFVRLKDCDLVKSGQ